MENKACRDCKYHKYKIVIKRCGFLWLETRKVVTDMCHVLKDRISGESISLNCDSLRYDKPTVYGTLKSKCGSTAKLFEPKEETK